MTTKANAERALRRVSFANARAGDTPTPERLISAKGEATVERFNTVVELVNVEGQVRTETVRGFRVRFDDPFERAATRGQLSTDPDINRQLHEAGRRYLAMHEAAEREPLCAANYDIRNTKGGSRLLRHDLLTRTEAQIDDLEAFFVAGASMGRDAVRVVDAIVLESKSPEEVGASISEYRGPSARAVGMHMLRVGLRALAVYFGLLTDERLSEHQ